jgi:energy-coupling factor transporter ATP-binding protein EcfA2
MSSNSRHGARDWPFIADYRQTQQGHMTAIAPEVRQGKAALSCFPTFEARERAFNDTVGRLVPYRLAGPQRFWAELSEISQSRLEAGGADRIAFITSNPRDCLAFATPHQVLTAACLRAGVPATAIAGETGSAAEAFRLTANRHQPLRTLSGGESVKLAMAKAAIAVRNSDRLCISSPFSWLSAANTDLLARLLARYEDRGLPVSIFALEAEDDMSAVPSLAEAAAGMPRVSFSLRLAGVDARLATAVALATSDPPRVHFADGAFALASPCFLTGDNGEGKSLLAKLMTGAIAAHGLLRVEPATGAQRPRMIFQDVVAQMLSRTVAGLVAEADDHVHAAYHDLAVGCRETTDSPVAVSMAALPETPSLLEIKLLLAAQRLSPQTALLILDEPDWGLSRQTAAAFVLAVVGAAHRRGIPVLVISHKPWWQPLARSCVKIAKTMNRPEMPDNRDGFLVTLRKEF